ncbi:MAG: diacylglycerol kinase family lipid kinase [Verrucomicrobia bacterium]|nr:diacylglycerol kinase family lipid kinase [Verrucomicrobiota bacterium]
MKTGIIVNPRSGRAARASAAIRALAAERGAPVWCTTHPRHASELAAAAVRNGCDLVVAVGGDGTINEVASVLVGTSAILGIVPCGSGDALGRHLRIHGPVRRAVRILRDGQPRALDSGLLDEHPFFSVAGFGFEAEIAHRFNRLRRRGFLRYLFVGAQVFRTWSPPEFEVRHDDGTLRLRALTLAIANTTQYGNNARIAPRASAVDGRLDLVAVPPVTAGNALPLLVRLFRGTLDRARGITHLRSTGFTVRRNEPGPVHTDGEVHVAGAAVEIVVRPTSLRVLVPPELPAET